MTRINELLKREISTCIEKYFEFPNVLVTIHAVETAEDLRSAQVFVGVIGETGDVLKKLNAKRGYIQGIVMKRVTLRCTPLLKFVADDSIERGVRILNILDDIGEIDLPDEPEAETKP
ncbi:30S ribosome-binding factor RbfA [Verrucomicrobiales bacterium]|nr:30S ribosome-binding factor RbfA [Verrucomicrobiales bacterium]